MSKSTKSQKAKAVMGHQDVARLLRAAPPEMDDLRQMRLERRVLAATEKGVGEAFPLEPKPTLPMRRLVPMPPSRLTLGILALAAAALLGFLLRGGLDQGASHAPAQGAHFAVRSADRTSEGVLALGTNLTTGEGERGSVEVGDVTAHLAERTTLRLASDALNDVAIRLEAGATEFAFHPQRRGRQHLTVTTPNARVEVVGTVFTVRVDGAGTEVSVTEGTVRVVRLSGGEASLVHAGDTLFVRGVGHAAASTARTNETDPAAPRAEELVPAPMAASPMAASPVLASPVLAVQPTNVTAARVVMGARSPDVLPVLTPSAPIAVASVGASSNPVAEGLVLASPSPSDAATVAVLEATPATSATSAAPVAVAQVPTSASAPGSAVVVAPEAPEPSAVSRGDRVAAATAPGRRPGPSAASTLASPRVHRAEGVSRGPQLSGPREEFVHERRVWGRVDDLQSSGQYERSLPLIVEIESTGAPEDRAEALYHHARTLDVALHRPAQALELYRRYLNTYPAGPRARESYLRIRSIENQP